MSCMNMCHEVTKTTVLSKQFLEAIQSMEVEQQYGVLSVRWTKKLW